MNKEQEKELFKFEDSKKIHELLVRHANGKGGSEIILKRYRELIEKLLKAQKFALEGEIFKWGRKMMDKKVPLKQMGEDPEDDGWYDYDEITSSIISHIRYDEKGNLKKE